MISARRLREYQVTAIRLARPNETSELRRERRIGPTEDVYVISIDATTNRHTDQDIMPAHLEMIVSEHPKIGDRFRMTFEPIVVGS